MQGTPTKYANWIYIKELPTKESRLNPFPIYNELRENTPVRYDADRDTWDVFRYEDVRRILQDNKTFSSVRGGGNIGSSILTMDPPKHTQMRAIVQKAFTPKAIADLAPRIAEITNELLDKGMKDGKIDIVRDLAYPLPVIVIADLIGCPSEDREKFKEWSDTMVKGAEENTDQAFAAIMAERMQAGLQLRDYFGKLLEERRQEPKDDLMTALLQAEVDGEKLSEDEVLSFCILLLVAGNETTTNLITNTVRLYIEQVGLQEKLQMNPELINSSIEESLRFYPSIQAIGRVTTVDTEIAGQKIKAGSSVVSWVSAANRDGAKFENPDTFIVDREQNAHLSFGFAIHFCLGAPLARLEAQVALRILLERMQNLQYTVPVNDLTPIPSPFVYGVKNLPITFDAK